MQAHTHTAALIAIRLPPVCTLSRRQMEPSQSLPHPQQPSRKISCVQKKLPLIFLRKAKYIRFFSLCIFPSVRCAIDLQQESREDVLPAGWFDITETDCSEVLPASIYIICWFCQLSKSGGLAQTACQGGKPVFAHHSRSSNYSSCHIRYTKWKQ